MESRGCSVVSKKTPTFGQITFLAQSSQIRIKVAFRSHQSLWDDVIDVQLSLSLPTQLAHISIAHQDSCPCFSPSFVAAIRP